MKKLLITVLTLIFLTGSVSLFGCKENDTPVESDKIILADFEQWGPDFQLLALYNSFGKITRNEDAKFVKSGVYSAKLQPIGGVAQPTLPFFIIPTTSDLFDFNYEDFTCYKELSAYLYNDTENQITVTVGLVSSYTYNTCDTIEGQQYVLMPKTWTRISYLIDLDFLQIAGTPESVKGVYFQFPNSGVIYPADAPTVYLDDVIIKKSESKREPNDIIELDQNEILDFEKQYQKYALKITRTGTVDQTGDVKVVKAEEYGIKATSGENVLRILRKNHTEFSGLFIHIPESILKKSDLTKIPVEEYANTYFCFDIYSNHPTFGQTQTVWLQTEGAKNRYAPLNLLQNNRGDMDKKAGEWSAWHEGFRSKPYQWNTYKITLWEMTKGLKMLDYVQKPGTMELVFTTNSSGQEWEMFLDNFRLEKGAKINYTE